MRLQKLLYKAGSWSLVFVGSGHLITALLLPNSPQQEIMIQTMKGFAIVMPGTTSNLYQFHQGFSLMMGVLLISYGAITLLFIKAASFDAVLKAPVLAFNILVSFVALILSVTYFFIVPIIFTGISFTSYALTWALCRWSNPDQPKTR